MLHYAAKNGETDAAELLLKSGAALDIKEVHMNYFLYSYLLSLFA